VGLNQFNRNHQLCNLGYWVRTSRAGRGVASSAGRLAARFALAELNLHRVEVLAATGNHASQRAAEKMGAVRESVSEISQWMDWCHANYSMDEASSFILSRDEAWKTEGEYGFAVLDAQTGMFLGGVGLNQFNRDHQLCNLGAGISTSGPVPNDKDTLLTVVDEVTPDSPSVMVRGPTTNGLNWPFVMLLLALGKLVPDGKIRSDGWPPPIVERKRVLPVIVKVPWPPGGGGPAPTHRGMLAFGVEEEMLPFEPMTASVPVADALVTVPGLLLSVNRTSLSVWPALTIWLVLRRLVNVIWIWPLLTAKSADAATGPSAVVPLAINVAWAGCTPTRPMTAAANSPDRSLHVAFMELAPR